MELNIQKTKIISFTRKTSSIHFKYFVKYVLMLRSECIKDLGIMLCSKLYFICHVDFVYSQTLKILGLIHFITYNFFSLGSLVVLYIALIRSNLECASVVWNNLTTTDSNRTANIQRKFSNLCYRFFSIWYVTQLWYSHLRTDRRENLKSYLFLIVFKEKINCHSIMDNVAIRVPTKQIR
jgi:hypothetical protein